MHKNEYKNIIKRYKIDEENYPKKLKNINNPPKELYVIGNLPDENKKTVAIVGSRNCSDYGNSIAKTIAKSLSLNDIQVVSGLALGIDSSAHLGSIEAEKETFAILGCGVNICYPSYNYNIYNQIIETGGGIISELPIDTPPLPYNFPLRNRIISGLSDIILIVEAKKQSGALITCEYALEQGKDIFAIPGRIGDILSEGTNNLIKEGAYIMTTIEDIYERLGVICDKKLSINEKDEERLDYFEKLIFKNLTYDLKHIEEIMIATKLPIEKCFNVLTSLQISGYAESPRINYFRRTI